MRYIVVAVVVVVVVFTLAHRYNAVRTLRTVANNPGAEEYLRRENKYKTEDYTRTPHVVVVFTLNRSFYPTTSAAAVPPVSFLILHPREIQVLWSQTMRQRKTKR